MAKVVCLGVCADALWSVLCSVSAVLLDATWGSAWFFTTGVLAMSGALAWTRSRTLQNSIGNY